MKTIWRNARLATLSAREADGIIARGALAVEGDRIAWAGPEDAIPRALREGAREVDLGGALVTPALIDCHTHLVYGGNRAGEIERRLRGESYEQIARSGGGIRATVAATRALPEEQLFEQARARLRTLAGQGVATVEIKSGYGLTLEHEARMLRVARRLGSSESLTVRTTYLGAHTVAPEFAGRLDDYIDAACQWLVELHAQGLVDAVDAYCDRVGFSLEQTRRVFEAARRLGLPVKLHAEQLSDSGGAKLAAAAGALSCDHLEYLGEDGVQAMARARSVAVLLPGAYYFLRETRLPPIDALRRAGVPIALATDHNPGTSPVLSPLLVLNMACILFGLSPFESLCGMTRNAARALGLAASHGVLEAGMRADFVAWDAQDAADLALNVGRNPCRRSVVGGVERAQGAAGAGS